MPLLRNDSIFPGGPTHCGSTMITYGGGFPLELSGPGRYAFHIIFSSSIINVTDES